MQYLPIHIDTDGATILVVGGGAAAEAKLRSLLKTQAHLRVVSAQVSDEIKRWADTERLEWRARDFTPKDMDGVILVYAATQDGVLNADIAAQATARGLPVNSADQKTASSFISPALVERSPVTISIGTEGSSPALVRAIKADMEARLPQNTGTIARIAQSLRARVKTALPDLAARQKFWGRIFAPERWNTHLDLSAAEFERQVETLLKDQPDTSGSVTLVGAGPGDPDLLTLAARRALHSADVIIYDRLVSAPVLELARREAEHIYVGKTPGKTSTPQAKINEILIQKAQSGLSVVRLKSGDPLIFGRADEEIEALFAENIAVDIIPGITSAAAAAAAIHASLTTRGTNKAVSFLTGHDAKGFAEQDWLNLASPGGRAAIYMGVGAARFIQGRLLLHGAESSRAVTVVENASRPNQIITETTLGDLPAAMSRAGVKGPAILLIGYERRVAQKLQERLAI